MKILYEKYNVPGEIIVMLLLYVYFLMSGHNVSITINPEEDDDDFSVDMMDLMDEKMTHIFNITTLVLSTLFWMVIINSLFL
jgi:hypothetical protein